MSADALREQYGPDEVEHERPVSWLRHLWLSYNNPFNLLLTVLALVSYFTGEMQGTALISTMVVANLIVMGTNVISSAGTRRFMRFFAPRSSIFDIITFAVMWYVLTARDALH